MKFQNIIFLTKISRDNEVNQRPKRNIEPIKRYQPEDLRIKKKERTAKSEDSGYGREVEVKGKVTVVLPVKLNNKILSLKIEDILNVPDLKDN